MNWVAHKDAQKALSDDGRYLVTWNRSAHGLWFNGWYLNTPHDESTRHNIAGSYDGEFVKDACVRHARQSESHEPNRSQALHNFNR